MEQQLEMVCSSGRPFQLMDVRVVDEGGANLPHDGEQARAAAHDMQRMHTCVPYMPPIGALSMASGC